MLDLAVKQLEEASALLNVALTKRNGVPMCGVPYHEESRERRNDGSRDGKDG